MLKEIKIFGIVLGFCALAFVCFNLFKPESKAAVSVQDELKAKGFWVEGKPLRLHLGCGETHFDGYANIDFPPSKHSVMNVKADIFADMTKLSFPRQSVDEIRLQHVFEHFSRVHALALLVHWHEWLKIGGILHLETPDIEGCAKIFSSDVPFRSKMKIVRQLAGDQTDSWGFHVDHWFAERFEHTLTAMGFEIVAIESRALEKDPYLSNVVVVAKKTKDLSRPHLRVIAENLLKESTISRREKASLNQWKSQLRAALNGHFSKDKGNRAVPNLAAKKEKFHNMQPLDCHVPLEEVHGFNQQERDRWVAIKALEVPKGSKVLDVGAGTCPYRHCFDHCVYKTHDFKEYQGEKLGGTKDYGHIDIESDITHLPVPDASFDVVLCTEVLEHVPEPIEALREMSRILKPGGKLFITAPLGSSLHQEPFHFYGGYTPYWYRHFAAKFGLQVKEITPNGGFFKFLAQECARVAWTFDQHKEFHGENGHFVYKLFNEILPRYLYVLDENKLIDEWTVGYHVELVKE